MAHSSDVRILVRGKDWFEAAAWEIESNMMQPADAFSVTVPNPGGVNTGKISRFDTVQVLVDETIQMSGYVDDVNYRGDAASGCTIEIVGRDRFGQLVDTSVTPGVLNGMDLQQIATTVAAPFVTVWNVDNELNRHRLLVAKRRYKRADANASRYAEQMADQSLLSQATVGRSMLSLDKKRLEKMKANIARLRAIVFPRIKVSADDSPISVIERAAAKTEMMVWLAADGTGVIARPNYDQQPKFAIRMYKDWPLTKSNNVKSFAHTVSGREIFATYRLVGSSANSADTYAVGSHHDVSAADTNVALARQKIVSGSGSNKKQAKQELDRDVQQRRFNETVLSYVVQGHVQGGNIWQVDTIVSVEDKINGFSGPYYLTRRRFTGSKEDGQVTEIELHPPGVLLP